MQKIKTYSIEEPLLYDASEVDRSQTVLTEVRLLDEQERMVRQETYTPEGKVESVELSTYREDGQPLSFELFYEPAHTLFRKTVFEYTESGALKREAVYIEGQLNAETIYFYDSSGLLLRKQYKTEDDPDQVKVYSWHPSFKACWVRKEILFDGELSEIITRKWENVQGEPFLAGEVSEKISDPIASRSKAFYKSTEMENGVCWELFNADGDYMEECREQYSEKGELERISFHLDPAEASDPYQEQVFKYDDKGRQVFEQRSHHGRIMETINSWFDAQGRLEKRLYKDNGTRIFFYEYETLS